jgi:hypothetical protein
MAILGGNGYSGLSFSRIGVFQVRRLLEMEKCQKVNISSPSNISELFHYHTEL